MGVCGPEPVEPPWTLGSGQGLAPPGNGGPTADAALLLYICSSQPSTTAPNRLPFGMLFLVPHLKALARQ